MFAKTLVHTPYFWGLYQPLREQARSHEFQLHSGLGAESVATPPAPTDLIVRDTQSALDSARRAWERTCSRRRWSKRPVFGGCTRLFASKLAPTNFSPIPGSAQRVSLRPGTNRPDRARYASPLLILPGGRGSELVREDVGSNALFLGAVPASSRASSLPRISAPFRARRRECGYTPGTNRLDRARYASPLLILPGGRGSELVREDIGPNALFLGAVPASSRASSLPRISAPFRARRRECFYAPGTNRNTPSVCSTTSFSLKRCGTYSPLTNALA
ncbi:Urea carboxylase/amidolyase [Pseudomonas syringae]|nr:Urea carboxylase/amidolyase [Pseudomonas syringae]